MNVFTLSLWENFWWDLIYFDQFLLLFDEGRKDPNTTISGPSTARKRNAIAAFRWRVDDGPTLNASLVALWCSGDPVQYC